MRFVASNCLREGMCLARPLYRNLDVMLSSGVTLTRQFIEGIQRCGFTGVYIEDELSEGIEVNSMISDSLRRNATKSLRSVLSMAAGGNDKAKVPDLSTQVENLVDELFSNRDVMVNMLDLSSYDDYTCTHSLNVAILSIVLGMGMGFSRADKLGIGAGALLHDIGKAVDHELEGTHVELGVEMCKRYHESPEVIHCIAAHHNDIEPTTVEAVLVQAADAISAARPGARRESIENYIRRLEKLEEIASSFQGVEKSFAIQSGREVRIMVKPDDVTDEGTKVLAKEIAKRIEKEMEYPGQIRVNVIRETRSTEFAK